MWKEMLSALKEVFVLLEKTEQNKESIKDVRSDFQKLEERVDKLASALQILAHDNLRLREEIQNARREESKERENLALKLENEMLKFERRLPSGKSE
jgi:biopolymer transport protein ExbB/TolQ